MRACATHAAWHAAHAAWHAAHAAWHAPWHATWVSLAGANRGM